MLAKKLAESIDFVQEISIVIKFKKTIIISEKEYLYRLQRGFAKILYSQIHIYNKL